MTSVVRKPWIVGVLKTQLEGLSPHKMKKSEFITEDGEIAVRVKEHRMAHIQKWHNASRYEAAIQDSSTNIRVVFTKECADVYREQSGRSIASLYTGSVIQINEFQIVLQGSNGAAFWRSKKGPQRNGESTPDGPMATTPYLRVTSINTISTSGSSNIPSTKGICSEEVIQTCLARVSRLQNETRETPKTAPAEANQVVVKVAKENIGQGREDRNEKRAAPMVTIGESTSLSLPFATQVIVNPPNLESKQTEISSQPVPVFSAEIYQQAGKYIPLHKGWGEGAFVPAYDTNIPKEHRKLLENPEAVHDPILDMMRKPLLLEAQIKALQSPIVSNSTPPCGQGTGEFLSVGPTDGPKPSSPISETMLATPERHTPENTMPSPESAGGREDEDSDDEPIPDWHSSPIRPPNGVFLPVSQLPERSRGEVPAVEASIGVERSGSAFLPEGNQSHNRNPLGQTRGQYDKSSSQKSATPDRPNAEFIHNPSQNTMQIDSSPPRSHRRALQTQMQESESEDDEDIPFQEPEEADKEVEFQSQARPELELAQGSRNVSQSQSPVDQRGGEILPIHSQGGCNESLRRSEPNYGPNHAYERSPNPAEVLESQSAVPKLPLGSSERADTLAERNLVHCTPTQEKSQYISYGFRSTSSAPPTGESAETSEVGRQSSRVLNSTSPADSRINLPSTCVLQGKRPSSKAGSNSPLSQMKGTHQPFLEPRSQPTFTGTIKNRRKSVAKKSASRQDLEIEESNCLSEQETMETSSSHRKESERHADKGHFMAAVVVARKVKSPEPKVVNPNAQTSRERYGTLNSLNLEFRKRQAEERALLDQRRQSIESKARPLEHDAWSIPNDSQDDEDATRNSGQSGESSSSEESNAPEESDDDSEEESNVSIYSHITLLRPGEARNKPGEDLEQNTQDLLQDSDESDDCNEDFRDALDSSSQLIRDAIIQVEDNRVIPNSTGSYSQSQSVPDASQLESPTSQSYMPTQQTSGGKSESSSVRLPPSSPLDTPASVMTSTPMDSSASFHPSTGSTERINVPATSQIPPQDFRECAEWEEAGGQELVPNSSQGEDSALPIEATFDVTTVHSLLANTDTQQPQENELSDDQGVTDRASEREDALPSSNARFQEASSQDPSRILDTVFPRGSSPRQGQKKSSPRGGSKTPPCQIEIYQTPFDSTAENCSGNISRIGETPFPRQRTDELSCNSPEFSPSIRRDASILLNAFLQETETPTDAMQMTASQSLETSPPRPTHAALSQLPETQNSGESIGKVSSMETNTSQASTGKSSQQAAQRTSPLQPVTPRSRRFTSLSPPTAAIEAPEFYAQQRKRRASAESATPLSVSRPKKLQRREISPSLSPMKSRKVAMPSFKAGKPESMIEVPRSPSPPLSQVPSLPLPAPSAVGLGDSGSTFPSTSAIKGESVRLPTSSTLEDDREKKSESEPISDSDNPFAHSQRPGVTRRPAPAPQPRRTALKRKTFAAVGTDSDAPNEEDLPAQSENQTIARKTATGRPPTSASEPDRKRRQWASDRHISAAPTLASKPAPAQEATAQKPEIVWRRRKTVSLESAPAPETPQKQPEAIKGGRLSMSFTGILPSSVTCTPNAFKARPRTSLSGPRTSDVRDRMSRLPGWSSLSAEARERMLAQKRAFLGPGEMRFDAPAEAAKERYVRNKRGKLLGFLSAGGGQRWWEEGTTATKKFAEAWGELKTVRRDAEEAAREKGELLGARRAAGSRRDVEGDEKMADAAGKNGNLQESQACTDSHLYEY